MKTRTNKIQPAIRLTVAGVLLAASAQTSAAIITLDASDVIAAGATQSGDLNGKTIFWTPATCLSCDADPSTYLFDISAWNGTDSLQLTNFWPGQGSISHIAIWGDTRDVPEPRTLALLWVGLLGFGLRHLKRADT